MCGGGDKSAAAEAELDRSEVKAASAKLLVVGDGVYDVAKFAPDHPGGEFFVRMFGGRDATEAFQSYHRRAWPAARMEKYRVAALAARETPVPADEAYLALSKSIDAAVGGPRGGFAPAAYYVKVGAILAAAAAIEAHMLWHGRTVVPALLLGFTYAFVGLNIQHDANHGALSKSPAVNTALGLAQDWIGGSRLLWTQEHVVMHHLFTNDVERDPDADGHGAVRLRATDAKRPWHALQHLYVFPGQATFAFKTLFLELLDLAGFHFNGEPISESARGYWAQTVGLKALFLARYVALPLYLEPTLWCALCIALTTMAGSFYLAFFFALSHNFDGVGTVGAEGSPASIPRDAAFSRRQVATASNVGGARLGWLNGGLNYQIEHHLFPRLHNGHYPAVAPIVKAWCKEQGYPYVHYPTVGENVRAMVRHLWRLGNVA